MMTRLFYFSLAFSISAHAQVAEPPQAPAPAVAATEVSEDANSDWRSYTRFVETNKRAHLDTAIARYTNDDGVEVDLIGAVHIGDKAYYDKLNALFEEYDVLLYEMVGNPDRINELTGKADAEKQAKPPVPGDPVQDEENLVEPPSETAPEEASAEKKPSTHPIMVLQNTMKDMLDLDHQVDHIDYSCENFVHADMSAKKFDEEKEKKGETFLLMMIRSYKQQFKMMAEGDTSGQVDLFAMIGNMLKYDAATGMKLTFGRALEDTESMIGGLEGESGSVILSERNKFALGVLRETLDKGEHKKIGIFYGAAHLPDMDKRMVEEFGFKRSQLDWLTAWDIPKK